MTNEQLRTHDKDIFRRIVERYNAVNPGRLLPVEAVAEFKISSIRQGVLLVLAIWSGPARVSFECLNAVLSRPEFAAITVHVLDIDLLEAPVVGELANLRLGGAGETFWIKDGSVRHTLMNYTTTEAPLVEDFTRSILEIDS